MWTCPVCNTGNREPVCDECSFDHSKDLAFG